MKILSKQMLQQFGIKRIKVKLCSLNQFSDKKNWLFYWWTFYGSKRDIKKGIRLAGLAIHFHLMY